MAGGWDATVSSQRTYCRRRSGTARKALCIWGDAGWGGLVRQGKYQDRRFSDELVEACVRLVREWNPHPAPAWVTGIPSLRHPDLVPDFARRLAVALNLPFDAVLEKTDNRAGAKDHGQQHPAGAQHRRFSGGQCHKRYCAAPVLLVDDMVDSRWTLDRCGLVVALTWQWRGVPSGARAHRIREMSMSLSPNTQAILLLMAPLIVGRNEPSADVLTPVRVQAAGAFLREKQQQPADLLAPNARAVLGECQQLIDSDRLKRLLGRGFSPEPGARALADAGDCG